jgi:hypothetical protein
MQRMPLQPWLPQYQFAANPLKHARHMHNMRCSNDEDEAIAIVQTGGEGCRQTLTLSLSSMKEGQPQEVGTA